MDRQKIKSKRKLRISVRFFLMFLIFSSIAIGSFSLFISFYFSRILVEKEYASFQALTSSFLAQSEHEINIMDEVSVDMFYSMLVQKNFTEYLDNQEYRLERFADLLDAFVALNGANYSLPLIALYSPEGEKILMSTYSGMVKVDMKSLDWVGTADQNKYRKVLSLPYKSSIMQMSQTIAPYYISLYRAFRDRNGYDVGYIETAQYAKKIFASITSHQKQVDPGLKVFVYNENGRLIYPYESDTIDGELEDYYYRMAGAEGPAREFTNPESGNKELLYAETSFYTGWTFICVQNISEILIPVRNVSRILMYATIFMFFIVTLISLYMSSSITRPIRDLNNKIHETSIDTLSSEKKHIRSSYDEFDELNDAFHSMSDKLKKSLDELLHSRQREMESRFLALQSQINPHFYYNSLSSIVALTEEHREEEVIQFCDNLSQFMRYSAHNQAGMVPLATELEYAEKYLYCLKVRYQTSLSYAVNIDETLQDLQIPKLIVQPLVENAVKYGTDSTPPWHIEVTAATVPGGWTISVRDSGPGFTGQALSDFSEKERSWDSIKSPGPGEEGLGLINVYSRWKIYCGSQFFFNIDSAEEGSTITIGYIKKRK